MATTSTNPIVTYFAELVSRLFSKSPLFFKIIQIVSVIVSLITGLPAYLTSVGVVLPPAILSLENSVVAIAGLVALFISSLPVATSVATSGTTVTTNTDKLPFTTAAAAKETK